MKTDIRQSSTLSVVIPSRHRLERLRRTLVQIADQEHKPEEVVIVEGSGDVELIAQLQREFGTRFARFKVAAAVQLGAAVQRNQGVALATGELIGFCDDDLDFETGCIAALRDFLEAHLDFGGVSATITNQAPRGFGRITRVIVGFMDERRGQPLDGRIVGPALNFLPALRSDAPAWCETEWLNTTCTFYRRTVLPVPPFESQFQGYSMLEDVCLSSRIGRTARLAVLRDSKVFHDTQPGDHKRSAAMVAGMGVQNRFYVATSALGRPKLLTWCQLAFWQAFCAVAAVRKFGPDWMASNWGAVTALVAISFGRK